MKLVSLFPGKSYGENDMIKNADEFYFLRTSKNMDDYTRSANDSAPMEVWLEVINKYPDMKEWVALNKTIPLEILERLAKDEDSRVRYTVAMKRKITTKMIEELAKDPDESVRRAIVNNTKTHKYVIEQLLNDEWEEIRIDAEKKLKSNH